MPTTSRPRVAVLRRLEPGRITLIENRSSAAAAAVANGLHSFEHDHPIKTVDRSERCRRIHAGGACIVDVGTIEQYVDVGFTHAAKTRFEPMSAHATDRHAGNGSQDFGGVSVWDFGDLGVSELSSGANEWSKGGADQNLVEDGIEVFLRRSFSFAF